MRDKRKPSGFSSRIRGRAQHLQPSLQFSSWWSPRCSARSVRSPLLRISASFPSALCFSLCALAYRLSLSVHPLPSCFFLSLPAVLSSRPISRSAFPFCFGSCSSALRSAFRFPVAALGGSALRFAPPQHRPSAFPWRFLSRFAPALSLGGFSHVSPQRFPLAVSPALRSSAFLWRFLSRFAPALSLSGFSLASSQRFPLAVSLALRPSAFPWRYLSRFVPALFFARTSLRTYACVEIFFKNPFRDF